MLVYPKPLNPKRNVVINSGLTADGRNGPADFPDYAVVTLGKDANQATDGGIFDESWKLPAKQ